uniref:Exocyst complex subunit Exo70 C-terminal domain-containing protein n=1 Tax=Quercus lobata TaxID=97700 RepID=A0A7N2R5R9_QUELO
MMVPTSSSGVAEAKFSFRWQCSLADRLCNLLVTLQLGKASGTFKPKGLTSLSGEDLAEFNEAFDDCHKKQSNWIICNEILREKRAKFRENAKLLVPAKANKSWGY